MAYTVMKFIQTTNVQLDPSTDKSEGTSLLARVQRKQTTSFSPLFHKARWECKVPATSARAYSNFPSLQLGIGLRDSY